MIGLALWVCTVHALLTESQATGNKIEEIILHLFVMDAC